MNEEVLVAEGPVVELTAADVAELKQRAAANPRRRVRICAHPNTGDALHEMLIVLMTDAYIRPHTHPGKSESVHVLEGEADLVLFTGDGAVRSVVPLGPYDSTRRFFYRVEEPVFHTLLVRSTFLVMHEVTNGPFRREETVFAPWAPSEDDPATAVEYLRGLAARLAGWAE
jgi:cupin fold WbuC family metalloprotein